MVCDGEMNSDTFIKSMKHLIKESAREIFLITDNLQVYHRYIAGNWLEKHTEQIEVFFLPSSSPELNTDEHLNCDLKAGVRAKAPKKQEIN